MVQRLEGALKAAFEAKQKTLRPEIQLLNRLLSIKNQDALKLVGAPGGPGPELGSRSRARPPAGRVCSREVQRLGGAALHSGLAGRGSAAELPHLPCPPRLRRRSARTPTC
jgi:hypothetical protein